jgi:hypothetical protein
MANGKIVSYINKAYSIESYITKEDNIKSNFALTASINKAYNLVSHIVLENNTLKKAYKISSYIDVPYKITSDIVSNKDN